MATVEEILIEVIARLGKLERELDDLKASSGETTSLDVVTSLPSEPHDGQIVLIADGTGANGNGAFWRYDSSLDSWNEI
jgi:hypothetical protein